jgi:hypothetical protein
VPSTELTEPIAVRDPEIEQLALRIRVVGALALLAVVLLVFGR